MYQHPESGFNRTVISMLSMFVTPEKTNWDDLLPFLMLAYNTSVHASTGHTPFRVVFGKSVACQGTWYIVIHEIPPHQLIWESMPCG